MAKLKPSQEAHIRALRRAGLGYRAIAEEVGLTRDDVRYFCKKNGLAGNAQTPSDDPVCLQCGKVLSITPKGRKRKFCSDQCRWAWWRTNEQDMPRPTGAHETIACAYCGKSITAYKRKQRRYCSHECYIRDRFWRVEDGREPYVPPKDR